MKITLLSIVGVLMGLSAAFAENSQDQNSSASPTPEKAQPSVATAAKSPDERAAPSPAKDAMKPANGTTKPEKSDKAEGKGKMFASKAAMIGMTEVKLGELAEKNGENAKVQKFGAQMVKDHGKANAKLKDIAVKEGIQLPVKLDAKHQQMADVLSALKGKDFDTAYINDMVDGHTKAVELFKMASEKCKDADLKSFAKETLPVIEHHLEMAKKLQSEMK